MQASAQRVGSIQGRQTPWVWALPLVLAVWAAAPTAASLADLWRRDPSFSHGPLIPLIAGGLLWSRRKHLRQWDAASGWGFAAVAATALLYVAAVWADIYFLKPLALIGMMIGGVWFLGGGRTARIALGALGFLVFMIPWPTTLTERLAFPLQMTSSAYAAMLGGMLGLPIHRDGIHLYVLPNPEAAPIYSIIVARQCSGLTSLVVLLAMGYLVAYHTPAKLGWRALLLSSVIPLALFANSIRLTLILAAGGYHSAALAKWVHDNEAPVLVLFCSMGLLALRQGLLAWLNRTPDDEGGPRGEMAASIPIAGA